MSPLLILCGWEKVDAQGGKGSNEEFWELRLCVTSFAELQNIIFMSSMDQGSE